MKTMLLVTSLVLIAQGSVISQTTETRRVLVPPPADPSVTQTQTKTTARKRVIIPTPPRPPITLAGSLTLSFEETFEGTDSWIAIKDATGAAVYTTPVSHRINDAIVSPTGKCALLLVYRQEGAGGWYGYLIKVTVQEGKAAIEKLWNEGEDILPGRRWWVTELGAISDDGATALMKMADMPAKHGTVDYRWQTWTLAPPKRLGVGLTTDNGLRNTSE